MAKLVSITYKAFNALLRKAKKAGALDLAENIDQNSQPGYGKGVTYAAQKKANAAGRVLLLRNDFKNLSRATGLGDGVRITRRGEFEGQEGVRGLGEEIRATRGKGSFPRTTSFGGTEASLMRRSTRADSRKERRDGYEEEMAWNRAEDRSAARTGRKIDRIRER